MKDFIWYIFEGLKAITPLVIGAFAGFIAWRQWRTAADKVKLDLYAKRFEIYEALYSFLSQVTRDCNFTNEEYLSFKRRTLSAQFLFDDSISEYLSKIGAVALDVRGRQRILENPEVLASEKHAASDMQAESLNWILDQYVKANTEFKPFLSFGGYKDSPGDWLKATGKFIASELKRCYDSNQ